MSFDIKVPPGKQGFVFPAEWHHHRATWLSWPHKEASWPGKLDSIYPVYAQFVKYLAQSEKVCINIGNEKLKVEALDYLDKAGVDISQVEIFPFATDDAWCRDHGPAFLINPTTKERVIVDWGYNAWGGKYPPFDQDDVIPTHIAKALGLPVFHPGIVMEGGSVEFNGAGTLLTTRACLLNENRNPHLNQEQIEQYLSDYYGVGQILWLGDGIIGDDTDGHIDDLTRFVNAHTVVTIVEENKSDENYEILQENVKELRKMRLLDGKPLDIIELPMPKPVIFEDQVLPASYANYYLCNKYLILPTYRDDVNDQKAFDILQKAHPEREVVALDSTDIIWGLGSFHCLSQQEPILL